MGTFIFALAVYSTVMVLLVALVAVLSRANSDRSPASRPVRAGLAGAALTHSKPRASVRGLGKAFTLPSVPRLLLPLPPNALTAHKSARS